MNGSAGTAVYCGQEVVELSIHLGRFSSIYLSEMMVLKGLMLIYIISKSPTITSTIYIYTDSQSAIEALNSHKINSALLLELINELASRNHIELSFCSNSGGSWNLKNIVENKMVVDRLKTWPGYLMNL